MASLAEKIYFRCPVFVQNILVSLYGVKLYRERYSKNASAYLQQLLESEKYTQEEMERFQECRFLELARTAIETVPHYRDWAKENGLSMKDFTSLADLQKFPILSKETVRANPERFVSDQVKHPEKLIKLYTSGTTGSPMTVYCDADARTHHYAFFSRLRHWFGLKPRSRRATLFGRIIMLPENNRPPFWRYDIAQNNLLMSSYHLKKENLKHYYEKLVKFRPDEIISYPSSLYQIALYIQENNLPKLTPKVVFTTAETLLAYQRDVIEATIDAPLIDQYGCTEMAFFASQCEHGTMHFHPEHGLVEVISSFSDSIDQVGGQLVVTGLINQKMPLVRYEVGDNISLIERKSACKCGRSFPQIRNLVGRIDDILYRKDGTPVGRLDPVFKGGLGIEAAQIYQDSCGDLTVYVKTKKYAFNKDGENWIVNEIRKRLGDDVSVTIEIRENLFDKIDSKFRPVISEFKPFEN